MGRGRAPCCVKVGLNKGSWTPEEDMRLIAYIHKHGHGNWRALPKLAGLLRCGKSCRLRWINYLRPDIKRGNFTKEEEDTIIKLHGLLGNKWSKIASCLPGRTDNEIKNVWNTHLKKRLVPKERKKPDKEQPGSPPSSITSASVSCSDEGESKTDKEEDDANLETKDEEIDKFEIPIEPNLDLWDMLHDSSLSDDVGLKTDGLDLPEIPLEPEIWNMISDDLDIAATMETTATATATATASDHQKTSTNFEAESSGGDESEKWLAYLEKELDLWGDEKQYNVADVEGGDPVASYFHALESSSSPLDLLY